MSHILLTVATWCMADPRPYQSVAECRAKILACVDTAQKYHTCFAAPDEKPWPNFNKEKAR